MRTESRVIAINSRVVEGRKVFLGAIGIFNSSKKVSTRQRAVAQWDKTCPRVPSLVGGLG